ncbi:MAG: hypothetical protein IPK80_25585 [Nannocystis sp.]|nr:hypothetical protein [Nannocystis sp.]
MRALGRVLRAPGLWLGLAALHVVLAKVLAAPVVASLGAALQPYHFSDRGALVPALAELLVAQPPVVVAFATAWIASALLGGLLQLVLAGGIIRRLAGPASIAEMAAESARYVPRFAALALYGWVPRAVVLGLVLADPLEIGATPRLVIGGLGLAICAHALELARARAVLCGGGAYHPRALVGAFSAVFSAPRRSLGAVLLWSAAAGLAVAAVAVVSRGLGYGWVIWAARLIAALGVGLQLWRIAVAVAAATGDRRV